MLGVAVAASHSQNLKSTVQEHQKKENVEFEMH